MATDIFRTSLAEVRWAHLITPRHQLDKSKPKAWTCDLLLPNSDEKAQSFLLAWKTSSSPCTAAASAAP